MDHSHLLVIVKRLARPISEIRSRFTLRQREREEERERGSERKSQRERERDRQRQRQTDRDREFLQCKGTAGWTIQVGPVRPKSGLQNRCPRARPPAPTPHATRSPLGPLPQARGGREPVVGRRRVCRSHSPDPSDRRAVCRNVAC